MKALLYRLRCIGLAGLLLAFLVGLMLLDTARLARILLFR